MKKKVLIIGGTSGLGRKMAEWYCARNWLVGIVGRRETLLQEIQLQFPLNARTCKLDIGEMDAGKRLDAFINELGGFDILILTASVIHFNDTLELKKELDSAGTNITGFLQVMNSAYQYCKRNNQGHIVVITSLAAARGSKTAPVYNASKAFQSSYAEGLRLKMKSENIDASVTELIPGYIQTDMAKGNRIFWMASVEKAARQAIRAIRNKKKRAFITKRWWWVYHMLRLMPSFLYDRLINSGITLKKK